MECVYGETSDVDARRVQGSCYQTRGSRLLSEEGENMKFRICRACGCSYQGFFCSECGFDNSIKEK